MPTRAARKASESLASLSSCRTPSAVTISIASICAERLRHFAPVPWVAVEIAPASVCLSMSPRFSSARPWRSSLRLRSPSRIPASTLTRLPGRSTSRIRFIPSIRSIAPSVTAAGVNECPEPATLTARPAVVAFTTASISPSRVCGWVITSGRQRCSRDQLRQW